jgi:hypothetical protein
MWEEEDLFQPSVGRACGMESQIGSVLQMARRLNMSSLTMEIWDASSILILSCTLQVTTPFLDATIVWWK